MNFLDGRRKLAVQGILRRAAFITTLCALLVYPSLALADTMSFAPLQGWGSVRSVASTYSGAHDSLSGTIHGAGWTGQEKYVPSHDPVEYRIWRTFLPFDSSGLPDNAVISEAYLEIGSVDGRVVTSSDFNLFVVQTNQQSAYSLQGSDFSRIATTSGGASQSASSVLTPTSVSIQLNATGKSWINKAGNTYLGLRTNRDISSVAPNATGGYGGERFSILQNFRLRVIYTVSPTASIALSTASLTPSCQQGQNAPTGLIQLTWQPLDGYVTPAQPDPQTLGKDGYVTFTGVYAPALVSAAPMENKRHYIGDPVQFTVQANGGLGTLHYKWKFDDHVSGVVTVGGNTPVLTIANAQPANSGDYWCVVTDALPQTLTSNVAALTVAEHLAFSDPLPPEVMGTYGSSITLSVTATGGYEPLTYQWFKDQAKTLVPIGTDSPQLTLDNLSPGDEGLYQVQVSDGNTESLDSLTNLQLVWGMPVSNIVGLTVITALLAITGVLILRRRSS